MKNKIIIGFTNKTSQILPRIFCRKFRHCAIITCDVDKYTMFQVGHRKLNLIYLIARDLKILEKHGWVFIKIKNADFIHKKFDISKRFTCVIFAKEIIGIKNPFIITPNGLYKFLVNNY